MSEPVFVITPIGGADTAIRRRADDLLELVIHPVIAALNRAGHDLTAVRADKIARPGSITDAIVEHILTSRVVIVDLSGLNPNVLYEMGIADSFGIPTVRLADDPASLPFDAKDHNAIELVSTAEGSLLGRAIETCKTALEAQLTHALADDFVPTSIVVRHARSAQVDSLAAHLSGGDEQDKALAMVLERLAQIEARLEGLADVRQAPASRLLAGAPVAAIALLKALAVAKKPVSVEVWESSLNGSPDLFEGAACLVERGLVERLVQSDGTHFVVGHATAIEEVRSKEWSGLVDSQAWLIAALFDASTAAG